MPFQGPVFNGCFTIQVLGTQNGDPNLENYPHVVDVVCKCWPRNQELLRWGASPDNSSMGVTPLQTAAVPEQNRLKGSGVFEGHGVESLAADFRVCRGQGVGPGPLLLFNCSPYI